MTSQAERYTRIIRESVRTSNSVSREEIIGVLNSLDVETEDINDAVQNSSIRITRDEKGFFENYISDLEDIEPWAKKIREEEETGAKKQAFKQANRELKELEREIQTAIDEEYTLEQIASVLNDPKLAEKGEKSIAELESLESRLKNLAKKKQDTGELLQKFENAEDKVKGRDILHGVEIRKKAVEELLSKSIIKDVDGKEVPLHLPDWERDRFEDTDVIYTTIEKDNYASRMLEVAKTLVEFAADLGEIDPETAFKTEVRVGDIEYKRKVKKDTQSADSPLFNHMDHSSFNVWMNAAVTKYHLENGVDSGFDRMIIIDHEVLESKVATLSVLVHELMHAYFQHTGEFEGAEGHKKIHQLSIRVLGTPIKEDKDNEDFQMEDLLNKINPVTREDINKAYIYSVASETLF